MKTEYGKLYLIPVPIGDNDPAETIPGPVLERMRNLDTFVVEEVRTARRVLSRCGLKGRIEALRFFPLNEHTADEEVDGYLSLFENSHDVGLMSEAGLPAVADPGARLVERCHDKGIGVVPLVGPSSLMLALMASGLNGQSFAFCGYLPAKTEQRRQAIRDRERESAAERKTLIFIETPYRNDALMADLVKFCRPSTRITVACDLTMPDSFILTRTASAWASKGLPSIGKRPCVFLILSQ